MRDHLNFVIFSMSRYPGAAGLPYPPAPPNLYTDAPDVKTSKNTSKHFVFTRQQSFCIIKKIKINNN